VIEELLRKTAGVRIAVFGDVMLDRYQWGSVTRISPEAPVPVVRLEGTTVAAGGAANVAANVIGLGASVRLFGRVGDDADGLLLRGELERAGIPSADLTVAGGRATIVKTRIVAHGQHIVRVDQEGAPDTGEAAGGADRDAIGAAVAWSDLVIVSDYAKGFLSPSLLSCLTESSKRAGKPLLADPKGKDFARYAGATLVTPNLREASEAAGLGTDASADEAAARLLPEGRFGALLVTEGAAGMTLFTADGPVLRFPAHARKVFDVTGAGDTVIAALGTALAAGFGLGDSVAFANLAAGIVVEQIGTTAITRAMLTDYEPEHRLEG
jgi:D-beta-D-heptose 7-phosphate kinase/D-beta-D-heptose 1-phosphate adenosyltransferase